MLCGNEFAVNACMGTEINSLALCLQTKASHYFVHWFNATNFCERNKKQTQQKTNIIMEILHDCERNKKQSI